MKGVVLSVGRERGRGRRVGRREARTCVRVGAVWRSAVTGGDALGVLEGGMGNRESVRDGGRIGGILDCLCTCTEFRISSE